MNTIRQWFAAGVLAAFAALIASCTTEIDLYDDEYQNDWFVWACQDGSSGLTQVKVRKMIAEESSLDEALRSWRSYLPPDPLNVNLLIGSYPIELKPVLYPPQSGLFAEDSNLIYETWVLPSPNQYITLDIQDPKSMKKASATIRTLRPLQFTFPSPGSEDSPFLFSLAGPNFHIAWSGGSVWIWSMKLLYLDILHNGDTVFRKPAYIAEPSFTTPSREFPLNYLWNLFRKIIPEDPEVEYRMFHRFEFQVWGGDSGLKSYLLTGQQFTDNRRGHFFNVEGANGLFYSVNQTPKIRIRPNDSFGNMLTLTDTLRYMKFSRYIYHGFFKDPDSTSVENPNLFVK